MKTEQPAKENDAANTVADSENESPKITWQFGEAIEIKGEKKEGIDLTLPIINSTIEKKKALW